MTGPCCSEWLPAGAYLVHGSLDGATMRVTGTHAEMAEMREAWRPVRWGRGGRNEMRWPGG